MYTVLSNFCQQRAWLCKHLKVSHLANAKLAQSRRHQIWMAVIQRFNPEYFVVGFFSRSLRRPYCQYCQFRLVGKTTNGQACSIPHSKETSQDIVNSNLFFSPLNGDTPQCDPFNLRPYFLLENIFFQNQPDFWLFSEFSSVVVDKGFVASFLLLFCPGGTPSYPGCGVRHPVLARGTPSCPCRQGYPRVPPTRDWVSPPWAQLPPPVTGVPPAWDLGPFGKWPGTSHWSTTQKGHGISGSIMGWGTPERTWDQWKYYRMGTTPAICGQTHTCENSTFPILRMLAVKMKNQDYFNLFNKYFSFPSSYPSGFLTSKEILKQRGWSITVLLESEHFIALWI